MPGVVSVFPSNMWKPATTRSYNFLGLDALGLDPAGLWQISRFGEGVVIGVFDSGKQELEGFQMVESIVGYLPYMLLKAQNS